MGHGSADIGCTLVGSFDRVRSAGPRRFAQCDDPRRRPDGLKSSTIAGAAVCAETIPAGAQATNIIAIACFIASLPD